MPTYEYRCSSCGQHVEVVQSFSDDPLTECASCGGPLKKVFAPVGIVFKGSGFYKTDSRKSTSASRDGGSKDKDSSPKDKASSKESSSNDSASTSKASGSSSTSSSDSKIA